MSSRAILGSAAVLSLLLVAAVSASQRISVSVFSSAPSCTGSAMTSTYPTDTCVNFQSPRGNYSSGYVNSPAPQPKCLSFYAHAGPSCAAQTTLERVECNRCMQSSNPAVGHFMFQCFEETGKVQAFDQCNSDCSACSATLEMQLGACATTNDGNMLPTLISECPRPMCVYFFPQAGANCTDPTTRLAWQCGSCQMDYDTGNYYTFNCTGDNSITSLMGCNADCSSCTSARAASMKTCTTYDQGAHTILFDKIAACGVQQFLYPTTDCSTPGIEYDAELDVCDKGVRTVSYTSSGDEQPRRSMRRLGA